MLKFSSEEEFGFDGWTALCGYIYIKRPAMLLTMANYCWFQCHNCFTNPQSLLNFRFYADPISYWTWASSSTRVLRSLAILTYNMSTQCLKSQWALIWPARHIYTTTHRNYASYKLNIYYDFINGYGYTYSRITIKVFSTLFRRVCLLYSIVNVVYLNIWKLLVTYRTLVIYFITLPTVSYE